MVHSFFSSFVKQAADYVHTQ